jgi:bifunctional UDP-N-acetylglucosamine pyrophosphorylase / glucosamine-1-phosphate N-acetyltransferase
MKLKTIILAAGQGTRMRSGIPKVLHTLAGCSLLEHVCALSGRLADNNTIVIYGHGGEQVPARMAHMDVRWVEQKEQLGTGHAVMQVVPEIDDDETVLILYGDVPLLRDETVQALLQCVGEQSLGLLTVRLAEPAGYGRIVRDPAGAVARIVEEKDASAAEQMIDEVNTGILAVNGAHIKAWLARLDNNNAQGEYYLTDIIAMAVGEGLSVRTVQPGDADEVMGINDRQQLAHLERVYQRRQADALMERGVTLLDPARFDLRGTVLEVGEDVEIDVNVVLEGDIRLGSRVRISANSVIRNASIGDDAEILPHCVIDDAEVGAFSRIGPFARLRPEARLSEHVHVGNFVEIKKTAVAQGSKINHLSYIGDTIVGTGVNIGAGTITCNYDGANKFQTIIEDGAFIGSDTQLVAPVRVGKNATIGAGSTITRDTPENQLTLSRSKQVSVDGWRRPEKIKR